MELALIYMRTFTASSSGIRLNRRVRDNEQSIARQKADNRFELIALNDKIENQEKNIHWVADDVKDSCTWNVKIELLSKLRINEMSPFYIPRGRGVRHCLFILRSQFILGKSWWRSGGIGLFLSHLSLGKTELSFFHHSWKNLVAIIVQTKDFNYKCLYRHYRGLFALHMRQSVNTHSSHGDEHCIFDSYSATSDSWEKKKLRTEGIHETISRHSFNHSISQKQRNHGSTESYGVFTKTIRKVFVSLWFCSNADIDVAEQFSEGRHGLRQRVYWRLVRKQWSIRCSSRIWRLLRTKSSTVSICSSTTFSVCVLYS